MRRHAFKRSAAALALAAAVGSGYLLARQGAPGAEPVAAPTRAVDTALPSVSLPNFQSIVARYGPAVVNVSVAGTVKQQGGVMTPFGPLEPDDPMLEFFRRFGPQIQVPESEHMVRGVGSGFIVSPDGVVLTNAHLIDAAQTVTVTLTDKREFAAKVVGVDKKTDVAVLKIDAEGLPTLPLGNPEQTRVGQWVLAIGSPFGFENSVTAGIVSATSRSLPDEGYVPFIQTDVAINPGNSGGPLLNLKGEVIGINSQIYSRSGGYQGISFAIPIDVAAHVKDQLLAHGKVTRGRVGLAVQDLDQGLAESFGLESAHGALVSQVEPDGPADKAGLVAGDVIVGVNGKKISASGELPPVVAQLKPGSEATLEIWRDGGAHEVTVTIGELQDATQVASGSNAASDGDRLGVAVRPLTEAERDAVHAEGGVLVVGVSGAAQHAGIEPGDVLLAVNGKQIESVERLQQLLAASEQHVALLVQRNDARIFVPIDLG